MAGDGLELYLITDPATENQKDSNATGYLQDLLDNYQPEGAMAVRNVDDFVNRVVAVCLLTGKKVRKLVIGCHGNGLDTGSGVFHIGATPYVSSKDDAEELKKKLAPIVPWLTAHADVYILTCKAGKSTVLLGMVSDALGGVAVHGFTDFIYTTSFLGYTSVDDQTDDGADEIVCWSNECVQVRTNALRPFTRR